MVCHRARSSGATDPGTGISTLVPHTGQVAGTLLVDGTLGLALSVGISLQSGQAGTGRGLVPLSADSVQSTGTGSAGIYPLRQGSSRYKLQSDLWTQQQGNISLNFNRQQKYSPLPLPLFGKS